MRKLLFPLLIFTLFVSACNKDDDQAAEDDLLIQEYLTSNGINAQEVEETGVFYIIDQEGSGSEFPNIASTVRVYYEGTLLDGTVFDGNIGGNWNDFPLIQMIRGWQYALPFFEKGAKGRLFIPSRHGYGNSDRNGIPANSVLIFDIELLNVF